MQIGLFGMTALIGFMLFFEGFSRKNPFMAWSGAILLMLCGTDVLHVGINYPSGALINENALNGTATAVTYTYTTLNNWFIQALGRLVFWIGWFGLLFPVVDFIKSKKNEETD